MQTRSVIPAQAGIQECRRFACGLPAMDTGLAGVTKQGSRFGFTKLQVTTQLGHIIPARPESRWRVGCELDEDGQASAGVTM